MAGLFGFFSSPSSNAQVYVDDAPKAETEESSTGLTGVAKYLQAQKPASVATGVAKYLQTKEQNVPSGVAKYLARQAIASKQKVEVEAVAVATGVAKYLEAHESKPKVRKSGVAKYLDSRPQSTVSGVAKYVARKVIAERNAPPAPKVTGVAKYLENRTEVIATGVSKYMARQALVAKQIVAETVESVTIAEPATGVEKYLRARG